MLNDLKQYGRKKLNKKQYGFVEGSSIELCKRDVFKEIKTQMLTQGNTVEKRIHVLFVDYSSAYNNIIREKLYQRLEEKQIVSKDKLNLLKFIHQQTKVVIGDEEVITNKGVPQGNLTSPLLFNIATEDLIEEMQKIDVNIFMYADDTALICRNRKELEKGIKVLENWSEENGLTINKKKSGVMIMSKRKSKGRGLEIDKLWDYPIVNNYKYLGTVMTKHMSIDSHLNETGQKVDYLTRKLTPFRINASVKFNVNMFKLMVAPQYRLLASLWDFIGKTAKKMITISYRKSFKKFMMMPPSVPNSVIDLLIGNMDELVGKMKTTIERQQNRAKKAEETA